MKLLILDTFYLLHRSFHAYPLDMQTSNGENTNVLFGFAQSVIKSILDFKPTHIVCAWESEDQPSFRKELYPQYQAHRVLADTEEEIVFRNQVSKVASFIEDFNIPRIFENGFEGDDAIGTIAKHNSLEPSAEVIIYTADKDMLQLIDDNIKVYRPSMPPFVKSKLFDVQNFKDDYGFDPSFMIDYKSLRGDPSDNIPGVKGIGDKTAKSLIQMYGSLESVYDNLHNIDKTSVRNKLENEKDNAFLSKQLATIITNIPIKFDINKAHIDNLDIKQLSKLLEHYEFNSLSRSLNALELFQRESIPDIEELFN